MPRTSHALVADGRVWILDPAEGEGVDERMRELGEPAGVIVLLDRHTRDSAAFAERLGVPVHEVPFDGIPDSPFEFRQLVRRRWWREVALWWPEGRVLAVGDALGSLGYMRTSAEPIGVHPLLRPWPPRRALAGIEPEHVLTGHGPGVHGAAAAEALRDALRSSRTRIPRLAVDGVRTALRGRR